ncbi:MAG TPA: FecR domain-containing protein, partial [Myxococcales bacterium]|nr:FecR domain-containing protein [Myxococcales bacterium]
MKPDIRPLGEGGATSAEERAAAALLAARLPERSLSPHARGRLWQGVLTRRSRRPARALWLGWAGALALAGTTAALLVLAPRQPRTGTLTFATGSVVASRASSQWVAAGAGATLPERSTLRTAQGRAVLDLGRASVLLDPAGSLQLASLDRHLELRLDRGRIVADVDPRRTGESFAVQTPRYRVTVKGTVFSVSVRSPADVEVSVRRGLVEVTGQGETWEVPAGRSWRSLSTGVAAPDDIPEGDFELVDRRVEREVSAAPPAGAAAAPAPPLTAPRRPPPAAPVPPPVPAVAAPVHLVRPRSIPVASTAPQRPRPEASHPVAGFAPAGAPAPAALPSPPTLPSPSASSAPVPVAA